MKMLRGGQRKHWSDLAKTKAWYNRVQWVENCSDYELDNKYAWQDGLRQNEADGNRTRIFEGIRKKGRIRRAHKDGVRNLEEIVDVVAKAKGLDDTHALFHAEIWSLFKTKTFTSFEVRNAINRYLEVFDLERVNPDSNHELQLLIKSYGIKQVFDRSLRISLYEKNSLLTLPLLWHMHIQAKSPHVSFVREIAELLIDEKIDNLFHYYFNDDDYKLYYTKAITALTNTLMDTSDEDQIGYGWEVDTLGSWPILPRLFNDFEQINQDLKIDLVGP